MLLGIPKEKRPRLEASAVHTQFRHVDFIARGQVFYVTNSIPILTDIAETGRIQFAVTLSWHVEKEDDGETSEKKDMRARRKGRTKAQERDNWNCRSYVLGHETVTGLDLSSLGMSCCDKKTDNVNKQGM